MPSKNPSKKALTSFKEPSKNPSKKRAVAWPPWCAPYFQRKKQGKEGQVCFGLDCFHIATTSGKGQGKVASLGGQWHHSGCLKGGIWHLKLRFRRARTGHKNPPRPEIRKKYEKIQTPPPWVGLRKYEEITEKVQKRSFSGHFCIFWVIFSYFRSPTHGGFCNFFVDFSYFRPRRIFVPCTSLMESQI